MNGISEQQKAALPGLTQQKAQVIGMATRMRRSIGYNEAFDTNNACHSSELVADMKATVDRCEATQLGRIAQEVHALNLPQDGN
ncbi:hypothetical protein A6C57_00025 [Fibrella sp. ES10-3-2-2]|nr:hypothetical protein A6C57_00025 [Fibrella sp. ES10-3-2-2]